MNSSNTQHQYTSIHPSSASVPFPSTRCQYASAVFSVSQVDQRGSWPRYRPHRDDFMISEHTNPLYSHWTHYMLISCTCHNLNHNWECSKAQWPKLYFSIHNIMCGWLPKCFFTSAFMYISQEKSPGRFLFYKYTDIYCPIVLCYQGSLYMIYKEIIQGKLTALRNGSHAIPPAVNRSVLKNQHWR